MGDDNSCSFPPTPELTPPLPFSFLSKSLVFNTLFKKRQQRETFTLLFYFLTDFIPCRVFVACASNHSHPPQTEIPRSSRSLYSVNNVLMEKQSSPCREIHIPLHKHIYLKITVVKIIYLLVPWLIYFRQKHNKKYLVKNNTRAIGYLTVQKNLDCQKT